MAQKNATPTKEQQEALRKAGLDPLHWVVTEEFPTFIVAYNWQTWEWRMIDKKEVETWFWF